MSTFIIGNVIQVNGTNCIECALCVPECPVEAITDREKYLDVDGFVRLIDVDIYISPDICIGCGDCIPICPTDVFSFISDEDEDEDDENTNPNTPQDPCTAAAQPAAHATELSKTNAFQSTSEQLSTYNDGNEHGYVYGSENGNVVPTDVQHGGPNGLNLSHNFTNPIASNHLHPNNTPPSVGDVYSLINSYNLHNTYSTYYITTQNGTTYALVVTDSVAMNQFFDNYPPVVQPPYAPNFPYPLNDEYNDVAFDANADNNQASYEIALAYMLDKYNTGLALLKKEDEDTGGGGFGKLGGTKNTGGSGYNQTKC